MKEFRRNNPVGNPYIGASWAIIGAYSYLLALGILTRSSSVITRAFLPSIIVACSFSIYFMARRVVRQLLGNNEAAYFKFGFSFHASNLILSLGIGIALFSIFTVLVLVSLKPQQYFETKLLGPLLVVLVALHYYANQRAVRYVTRASQEQRKETNISRPASDYIGDTASY